MRILPSLERSRDEADCDICAPGADNCIVVMHWPHAGGNGAGGDGSTAPTGYHVRFRSGYNRVLDNLMSRGFRQLVAGFSFASHRTLILIALAAVAQRGGLPQRNTGEDDYETVAAAREAE